MDSITLKAVLENLDSLIDRLQECLETTDWSPGRRLEIRLAVEEAVVNVINHAYPEEPGDVTLGCTLEGGRMVIRITDEGIPFDVSTHRDPDMGGDVDERAIGGLGIYLLRKLADSMEYAREEDRNVLILHFKEAEK